jgi:hypothetical protein
MYTCINKTSWQIFYSSTTPLLLVFCAVTNDPKKDQFINFLTGYEFPFLTGLMTSYLCDVICHIFVTSSTHRIHDVILWWRDFLTRFMTSYFCDVISSPVLWRHIFVTSFPHRSYEFPRILIRDMVFGIQTGIKRSDWLSRPGNEHQKFNTVEIVFLLMALSTVLINMPARLPSNVSSSLSRIGHCQPSICSCSTRCRIKKGVRVAK